MTHSTPLTLVASLEQATEDPYVREGILVPWDEPGRANLGPFGVPGGRGLMVRRQFAQSLRADAKIVGVYGHNAPGVDAPSVSRVIALENRPEGLWGRIRIARTARGAELVAELDAGVRDGLSVEVPDLQFDQEGHVIGGRLDYYAHVAVGAFDSARVSARTAPVTTSNGDSVTLPAPAAQPAPQPAPVLQANLTPGLPPQGQPAPVPAPAAPVATPAPTPAPVPAPAAPVATPAPAPAQSLEAMFAAIVAAQGQPAPAPAPTPAPADAGQLLLAALQQLQAGAYAAPTGPSAAALLGTPSVPAAQGQPGQDPVAHVATLQAALANNPGDRALMAALQDVTHSGLPMFQRPSGTIGEKLWEGTKETTRPWCDLMTPAQLTSMKGTSWQWTRGPEVKAWAGDKTEVPTNPVALEEVPWTARRCAGGWDIDRAYLDFGTPEFWTEFYSEQTRSYRELTNTWAAEFLVAQALDVSVDANVPASYVAYERTVDAGPTQVLRAAALGTAIMEDTPRVKSGPDWIAMNTLDWLSMADLTTLDLPAFLALLKVDPNKFMRTSLVPRGRVVLGVKGATKFRELGGGAPIRVDALDVARGGIDNAVYGYAAYEHQRPGGVISVPLAAAVDAG